MEARIFHLVSSLRLSGYPRADYRTVLELVESQSVGLGRLELFRG
jgi:hypothetical protein